VDASSRTFSRLLPELADVRSVYAPDLPGYGESDPSPTRSMVEAATAVSDLASDCACGKSTCWEFNTAPAWRWNSPPRGRNS
jgi:pimeloyl-ACP methyl ester carboxylesterase